MQIAPNCSCCVRQPSVNNNTGLQILNSYFFLKNRTKFLIETAFKFDNLKHLKEKNFTLKKHSDSQQLIQNIEKIKT